MSAEISVYCQKTIAHITPEMILAGISTVDFYTDANAYGIEDLSFVEAALIHLKVTTQQPGFQQYTLHYRPSGSRQVEIRRRKSADEVIRDRTETLEQLTLKSPLLAHRLREPLNQTIDIVQFSLTSEQLEDMAIVLSYEVAHWFAKIGGGYLRDDRGEWWTIDEDGCFTLLFPRY
jgi:hypothetical protein